MAENKREEELKRKLSEAIAKAAEEEEEEEEEEVDLEKEAEEFIKSLPAEVQRRTRALEVLDKRYKDLNARFREEVRQLELRYEAQYAPLFARRAEIVAGPAEPTAEELSEAKEVPEAPAASTVKGVPNFWLKAMQGIELLAQNITERDEEALAHLVNVRAETLTGENKGFRIVFSFSENEFFTNTDLAKTYFLDNDPDGDVLDHVEGTEINWKPGKDLTVKIVKKKQKHKGSKNVRVVTKTEPCESFFNFFKPPAAPSDEDEEAGEAFEQLMELDLIMGQALRDRVVPRAFAFFTGLEREEDEDEGFEFEDDGEDEDGEGAGDDDEEGEGEEEEAPRGRSGRGSRHGGGGGGAPPQPPQECKQQ